VRVLVAKEPLAYRAQITKDKLQWVEWPKNAVPEGAFTSVEQLLGTQQELKRMVKGAIEKGEPILVSKITKPGETLGLPQVVKEGMRAVSISIDAVSGVAGFVSAGDRVDINLIRTQNGDLTSKVILQNVLVLAVDQRTDTTANGPKVGSTVTVEVDTRQAQLLALARASGTLSLILRGLDGSDSVDTSAVSVTELLDGPKEVEEAGAKVRVRRAGSLQEVGVDGAAGDSGQTGN